MKTLFKISVFVIVCLALSSCRSNDLRKPKMTGGPCEYDTFAVSVVIDSVSAAENVVHYSVFTNSDDEILRKALGFYNFNKDTVNPDCISANSFSAGDTLAAQVMMRNTGTCTPVILNIIDNAECFR